MADGDTRAVLESIAFGLDERITPGDRLRAVEQLRDMTNSDAKRDELTPEQVQAELDSLASAVPGMFECAIGPDGVLPPPSEYAATLLAQTAVLAEDLHAARKRIDELEATLREIAEAMADDTPDAEVVVGELPGA